MGGSAGRLPRWSALAALFTALTALLTYPLSLEPGSRALALSADTRLFLWTLSWDIHALLTSPFSLFDANIFYPERHTLAYSEHLLGSALVGAPWLLATGNPLLALNAVVLLSCVLSGLGGYFLARQLGIRAPGALATGLLFAFAPPRFCRLGQLHLAVVEWIPVCLGFLHGYLARGRRRDLVLACVFFTLQALSSGHGGLFLMLAAAGLVVYTAALGHGPRPWKILRDLGAVGLLALATNLVFLIPYLEARRDVGLQRTMGAVQDWAPNAVSFLAAPTHLQTWLLGEERIRRANAFLFPGFVCLALAAVSLVPRKGPAGAMEGAPEPDAPGAGLKIVLLDAGVSLATLAALAVQASGGFEWTLGGLTLSAHSALRPAAAAGFLLALRFALVGRSPYAFRAPLGRAGALVRTAVAARMDAATGFYLFLGLGSLWASLGPSFGLYAALYRMVPGFDLIRVPSRLTILTLLSLAVLAGAGLERLLERFQGARRPLGAFVLVLLVAECAAFPLNAKPYRIPAPLIDRDVLSLEAPVTLVELPVVDPRDAVGSARDHSLYLLHSMVHWRPMVNGYSGFVPPRHEELFHHLVDFPDEASLRALEALGVRYAVVHPDLYGKGGWERTRHRLDAFPERLKLVRSEEDGLVYSLPEARGTLP